MNTLFLMGISAAIARLKRKYPRCGKIQTAPRRIRGSVTCKFCGHPVRGDRMAFGR